MSRPKNILGLKAAKFGAIAVDGGMGTVLTEVLGDTVQGTASLILNEGTEETVNVEEYDEAFDIIETAPGEWVFALESYNVSAKALGDLGVGEYTEGEDDAPDSVGIDTPVTKEMSVEVETRNGAKLQIPRMKLRFRPQFDLNKSQFGRLIVSGTPMKPTKAATKMITKIDAPAS